MWNVLRQFFLAVFVAAFSCFNFASLAAAESEFDTVVAPLLKLHCGKCHAADGEGDVDLLALRKEHLASQSELISSVVDALDFREMPPEDEPAMDDQVREDLIKRLKSILRQSHGGQAVYPHTPIRRMNRFQYNNAVMDLFDLHCIVFTLPERMMREHNGYFRPSTGQMADVVSVGNRPLGKSQLIEPRLAGVAAFPQDLRAEHGFDNRGDHLSLSPLLMESFLKLGQSITQSPDFTVRRVGVWKTFFAPPPARTNLAVAARDRLRPFLTRAFRQPIDDKTLVRYAAFVDRQLHAGVTFTDAMKMAAAATIASPRFLYLFDQGQSPAVDGLGSKQPTVRIKDRELASRLSFFLWGSLPDDELMELAAADQLHKPDVLDAQLDRMLTDRKLKRFCDSFPSQWLQLERLISSVPDPKTYPEFYFSKYRDSMHMMLEPLLLFETILIENLPVTQLIDSDFSYRSARLENAYGDLSSASPSGKRKPGGQVMALKFNRVDLKDRRTGGVITNAAVMTMTSGPERTQPITRGAWLATVVFNNPPEPPPADVPALDEKPAEGEDHLTLRERLALHRERADCKGCHEQIDPLGFALENYDAIGKWRDKYDNDRKVDMQGTLLRKHDFADVAEFKDAILVERDRFTRGLAGHLLSFALARELGAADQSALDKIADATAADDYRIQTLIKQVVLSEPFQSKTIEVEQ
ncbi:DUF1592 domain-containing protein [Planctomycetes bacterium K23_9]|uniref:Planctomycete cytochrome C n=1 Tax=Stieleria marina TaxID=1930275 RepID=A0A517NWX2_9BACT|nr:hypothetical protein K239x_36370 [Planctomycetes bacterium K23_9]